MFIPVSNSYGCYFVSNWAQHYRVFMNTLKPTEVERHLNAPSLSTQFPLQTNMFIDIKVFP